MAQEILDFIRSKIRSFEKFEQQILDECRFEFQGQNLVTSSDLVEPLRNLEFLDGDFKGEDWLRSYSGLFEYLCYSHMGLTAPSFLKLYVLTVSLDNFVRFPYSDSLEFSLAQILIALNRTGEKLQVPKRPMAAYAARLFGIVEETVFWNKELVTAEIAAFLILVDSTAGNNNRIYAAFLKHKELIDKICLNEMGCAEKECLFALFGLNDRESRRKE